MTIRDFCILVRGKVKNILFLHSPNLLHEIFFFSFINKYLELTTINDRNKRYRPGGLDGSLRIYNLTDAEAGQYECVAKTTVGSVSTVSSLRVHGPPGKAKSLIFFLKNARYKIDELFRPTWRNIRL